MGNAVKVPFLDLAGQYRALEGEITEAIGKVCSQAHFILGPEVQQFEKDFANFLGGEFAAGVASGTDALALALRALNIGSGDEVLVPANSFIASALAVLLAGSRPVLVDVDPRTHLIDLEDAERRLTERTRVIMPVHLYGRCVDMTALGEFAARNGLSVVEDAAQAHGAKWEGRSAGTFGDYGCFSFYPGKNLGAFGDGGAVVAQSEKAIARIRSLRNYGSEVKYYHPEVGTNSRLDGVQAAVLSVKLRRLSEWNMARSRLAGRYTRALSPLRELGLELPEMPAAEQHVFHIYAVQHAKRDKLLAHLHSNGVQAQIHYPIPIHLQEGYRFLGFGEGDFPVTESIAKKVFSLPLFPEMTEEQQDTVIETLHQGLLSLCD